MLGTNGEERRERLQSSLHQEEGRASCCAHHSGAGSTEDIDAERLDVGIAVKGFRKGGANRFIEAQAATVQENLINILESKRVSLAIKETNRVVPNTYS
jgi:hypothetical protein